MKKLYSLLFTTIALSITGCNENESKKNSEYIIRINQVDEKTKELEQRLIDLNDVKSCETIELKDGKYVVKSKLTGSHVPDVYWFKNQANLCIYSFDIVIGENWGLMDKGCNRIINSAIMNDVFYSSIPDELTEGLNERLAYGQNFICSKNNLEDWKTKLNKISEESKDNAEEIDQIKKEMNEYKNK